MNLFDNGAPQSETQQSWSDTTDRSSALMQEMSAKLETVTLERDRLKLKLAKHLNVSRERLSAIQELCATNQQLQEECQRLQMQLSETQNLNQSLHSENDSLRNSAGLMLRDEQERIAAENAAVRDRNSELEKLVDMSSVEAVHSAEEQRDQALRDCRNQTRAAKNQADHARKEAKKQIEAAKKDAEKRIKQSKSECGFWKVTTFIAAAAWILTIVYQLGIPF